MTLQTRNPRAIAVLVLFLAVVMGVGILIGTLNAPGDWYRDLEKPFFNPPNWIFAPVWTVLYVFIAIAGWRTFMQVPRSAAMVFWCVQMLLNWLWSPLFFGFHQVWTAFVVIVAMFAVISMFIGSRWRDDRISALLFVVYAAWVGFAAVLNLSLAVLN